MTDQPLQRTQRLRALVVSLLWLALLVWLLRDGARLLPNALARQLSVETYSILVQLVAMTIGLGASFALLAAPRRGLGLQSGQGRGVLLTALLAPATYVVICYAAIGLALPTLKEELARGGTDLVRQQGGAVISAMTRASVGATLVWAVVVSPLGEELLFRGALWGAFQGLLERVEAKTAPREISEGLPLERSLVVDLLAWTLRSGTLTTLIVAAIFAALHADLSGSQGIVRVASTAGLAVACGFARQRTGELAAPIVLHVIVNTLGLASARRWVVTETFPKYYTVPALASLAGAVGLVVALGMLIKRPRRDSR
jgi:membrane protease YdiL (CAAX protease family)